MVRPAETTPIFVSMDRRRLATESRAALWRLVLMFVAEEWPVASSPSIRRICLVLAELGPLVVSVSLLSGPETFAVISESADGIDFRTSRERFETDLLPAVKNLPIQPNIELLELDQ